MTTATSTASECTCHKFIRLHDGVCAVHGAVRKQEADDDDNSCGECGHPYKPRDETHYPECSRITTSEEGDTNTCHECGKEFEEHDGISGYTSENDRRSYDFDCAIKLGIEVDEYGLLITSNNQQANPASE